MQLDKNQRVFFELLRVGLWGKVSENHNDDVNFNLNDNENKKDNDDLNVNPNLSGKVEWDKVYLLSQEQSVQGLVLQGLEWFIEHGAISKADIPQELLLMWIGEVQMMEEGNRSMNEFIARLIERLRKENVYAILVKGQGIAQCYEKPLWRTSGDIDLLLSDTSYEKAKKVLLPMATDVETEYTHFKHQGMTIDDFVVELHGTFHSRLSKRVDNMIDGVQKDVFNGGNVRSEDFNVNLNDNYNGAAPHSKSVKVFLPAPNEDVIFVFTHILHHFFFEGIGLRQICDWCRLLYRYQKEIDIKLLEKRLCIAGLMSEWKAFAAFAVEYLGMPVETMPFLNDNVNLDANLKRKAEKIRDFVLEVGNFGHKQRRDFSGMSYLRRKFVSVWGRLSDMLRHFSVFPKDSVVFFGGVLRSGLHAVVRGE